jgi:hypothetical protein
MAEDTIPPEVTAMADKLELAVSFCGGGPLITPGLMVLLGRFVAFEAGSETRLPEGLDIAWKLMRSAAIIEAVKLYGPKA